MTKTEAISGRYYIMIWSLFFYFSILFRISCFILGILTVAWHEAVTSFFCLCSFTIKSSWDKE